MFSGLHPFKSARALLSHRSGAAAVEFAFVFPILLTLYMGGVELTLGITINKKIKHVSSIVSDLVAQDQNTTKEELDEILNVSSSLIYPYGTDNYGVSVTGLKVDASGQATVAWSRSLKIPSAPRGSVLALPDELAALRSAFVVVSRTSYLYTPAGGYGISQPFQLEGFTYLTPRNGSVVNCTDCS